MREMSAAAIVEVINDAVYQDKKDLFFEGSRVITAVSHSESIALDLEIGVRFVTKAEALTVLKQCQRGEEQSER